MQNFWFTSDTHYGHSKVLQYSKRPFADVDEMEDALITQWNSVVKPGDCVYHLGDFAFRRPPDAVRIAQRLQGQKFLIFGNHDKRLIGNKPFMDEWVWARDYAEISIGDQKIILSHYPYLTWNKSHYGSWDLHGHCHGSLKPDPHARRQDVGVDVWNYTPVHFDELKAVMDAKTFRPVDHHGARGENDEED